MIKCRTWFSCARLFSISFEKVFKIKKILLLGSNGFIGKNLKHFLAKNYILATPTRSELDLTNEYDVNQYLYNNYYDIVIHSAVNTKQSDRLLKDSLKMFFTLEKNASLFGKMFYFGSGAEFSKSKPIINVSEDDFGKVIPSDDYGFTKYTISKQIEYSDNIVNLRLFGVYGKYEHWQTKFISNSLLKRIYHLPITLRQNVFFDYLYIDDLCKIVEILIETNQKHKSYHVISGKKIDLLSIANTILDVTNSKPPIIVYKDGFANEYTGSNARLLNEIGHFEFTDLVCGVRKLYEFYAADQEHYPARDLIY